MTKYRSILRTILLFALVTGTENREAPAAMPPAYNVTDLGTLGGTVVYGTGINASGQVTGYSYTNGNTAIHAFLYDGALHDLETVTEAFSEGTSINDVGQVVGQTEAFGFHAYLWTPIAPNAASGARVDLGTLGGTSSNAQGINAAGQVSGYSGTTEDAGTEYETHHAFLWTPTTANAASGSMIDLGTLGGRSSYGDDINDSGQITGLSETPGDELYSSHAFLWTPTMPGGASGSMNDLGTLGGTYSQGFDVNASGQVVGLSSTTGNTYQHAFLYDGTMHDLGTLGGTFSNAQGINASGEVTGSAATSGDVTNHAFLYTSGSGMVDLNSLVDPQSGWELTFGGAINDAGQITGFGEIGGQQHAFLLTPVPEPASLALLALGLPLLVWRNSRRSITGGTRGALGPMTVSVVSSWRRNADPR